MIDYEFIILHTLIQIFSYGTALVLVLSCDRYIDAFLDYIWK